LKGIRIMARLETVSKSEVLNEANQELIKWTSQGVTTERGLLNVAYRIRAMQLLKDGYPWLVDPIKARNGEPDAWQPLILMELGKIADVGAMQAIAAKLCEIKPKAKEGAAMVRNARLGKPAGDPYQLANILIDKINHYTLTHEISKAEILEALQIAHSQAEGDL
jgi:hypothetical protein